MLTVTDIQFQAWLAALLWPLARVLGLMMTAPIIDNPGIPMTVKIGLGLLITVALVPGLDPLPAVSVGSWEGLAVLVREIVIGVTLGMVMQVVFGAVDLAGELAGTQMGLGFAAQFDPATASNSLVVTQFLAMLASLVFFAMDGHLMLFATLAETFHRVPIGLTGLRPQAWQGLAGLGSDLMHSGLMMALPVAAALVVANMALGLLTRAAPQLNIFSIGFPITLTAGMAVLTLGMPEIIQAFELMWSNGCASVLRVAGAL